MAVWTSVARGATELVVSEGTEMLGVVPAFGEGVGYRGLWVPETVMLLCLSTRELGEVPLVAFGVWVPETRPWSLTCRDAGRC